METAVVVIGAVLLFIIAIVSIGEKLNKDFKRKHNAH